MINFLVGLFVISISTIMLGLIGKLLRCITPSLRFNYQDEKEINSSVLEIITGLCFVIILSIFSFVFYILYLVINALGWWFMS